jgi:transcriptional regulator with XRE-family HTH domain
MYLNLGRRIFEYRKTLGMTQEELSQRLGVTPQAVSKWENEVSCPDIMLLPDLADIFEITIDELFKHEKGCKYEETIKPYKLGSRR